MNFNNVSFEAAFGTFEQLCESTVPEICFSGRSNVGKSSIINKTLGRKSLARVSTKPGKTVTVNFYKLDGLRLVDLPGYGYAKVDFKERQRWAELMEGYFKSGRNIPLVFQLIDSRHPATDFDISMLDFLSQMEIPYVIILTKCDKLNKTEFNTRMSSIYEELGELAEGVEIIPTSAQNGKGCEQIREIISQIYDGVEG
ncbi:MAG: YihA family ribosome biogenesis GTP-binding protein [Ruminococcaceae bacterium]|nr:YihA family ribosome biogenesis GTP-binding protein [Oscillospiraceae bacterium]MEE1197590.1 ribosome biogenesis GTP-binding protein YihA/YsxC [Acutalibacteraceae bacterium]